MGTTPAPRRAVVAARSSDTDRPAQRLDAGGGRPTPRRVIELGFWRKLMLDDFEEIANHILRTNVAHSIAREQAKIFAIILWDSFAIDVASHEQADALLKATNQSAYECPDRRTNTVNIIRARLDN